MLLHVRPEVSTGAIDPLTQVPNKQTTELETDVMLNDGQGMVIGGLIDEQDHHATSRRFRTLGDMWRVGFLFRKSDVHQGAQGSDHRADPANPALLGPTTSDFEQGELVRAETPLFQGPLCYTDRPYEAHLPDGKRVAKPYIPPRAILPQVDRQPCNYCEAPWPQYYVPQQAVPTAAPGRRAKPAASSSASSATTALILAHAARGLVAGGNAAAAAGGWRVRAGVRRLRGRLSGRRRLDHQRPTVNAIGENRTWPNAWRFPKSSNGSSKSAKPRKIAVRVAEHRKTNERRQKRRRKSDR